jgi:hypothetical protein
MEPSKSILDRIAPKGGDSLNWGEDVYLPAQKRDYRDRLIYMTPLLFAPYFPLVRILLRKQPVLRDRLFYGGIVVALAHGAWLIGRAKETSKELKSHSGTIRE